MVKRSKEEPPSFFQFLTLYTNSQDPLFAYRIKLLQFLQRSHSYNAAELLSSIEQTVLHAERAILHGKVPQVHEQSLLIHLADAKPREGIGNAGLRAS